MIQLTGVLLLVFGTTSGGGQIDRTADDLVAQGLALRRAGRTEEALETLERAYAVAPSPRTAGQVGLVEASSERWLEAEKHLESALGSHDSWVRRNRPLLEGAMELSHQHVGQLVITGPPGVTVFVAGNLVGKLPIVAPVRVVEGNLPVSATAPGYKQLIRAVDVPGGRQVEVSVLMEPLALESSGLRPGFESGHSGHSEWRPWAGGALLVAGVAALLTGATLVAIDRDGCCGSRSVETRRTGWVVVGAGSVLAAAGGLVLWMASDRGGSASVAVLPTGLQLTGLF